MATDELPGDQERFSRLMEVVALASVGEYTAALDHCGDMREDDFGMLEEGLRVFISELQHGRAAREAADAALGQPADAEPPDAEPPRA